MDWKYYGYNIGIFAFTYIFSKILSLKSNDNPLLNVADMKPSFGKTLTDCVYYPIKEEFQYRLVPYTFGLYLLNFDSNQLQLFLYLYGGLYFGAIHIINIPDRPLFIKVYHSLYAGTMGMILSRLFHETSKTSIGKAFVYTVVQHGFHNLMCNVYVLSKKMNK